MKTAISVTLIFLICPAIASAQLTVHEWGTFTSLQDESGQAIGGINSDDEPVPQFVHRLRVGLIQSTPSFSQGLPRCFPDVTMRLETPVLYFHSPKGAAPATLDVKATFNGGWLTEFYPYAAVEASGFSASGVPGKLTSQSKGTLKWTGVQIGTDGELQKTTDHVWIAPRNVDAAAVSVANQQHKLETEKYLFYRGVAHLDAPLRIRSDGKLLHFEPQIDADAKLATALTIKNIWQYQMRDDGKSAFRMIEPMQVLAGSTGTTATPATFADAEFSTENLEKLRLAMRQALVADGLFTDEAEALLATWELSYFKSRGMRVLFLTPQVWTDHYLPLELSVAAKITRTMVGRIELVTPLERAGLQQIVRSTDKQAQDEAYQKLGRFRNGLVLDEQQQHPSKELAEFISSRNLEGFAQQH